MKNSGHSRIFWPMPIFFWWLICFFNSPGFVQPEASVILVTFFKKKNSEISYQFAEIHKHMNTLLALTSTPPHSLRPQTEA